MSKQPTREKERLRWEKKTKLARAYGLIQGLLVGIDCCKEEINHEGLKNVLVEVRDILKQLGGGK